MDEKYTFARLSELLEEVAALDIKGAQRHVRDSEFWGAPYGTPLPLPEGYGRSDDLLSSAAEAPSIRKSPIPDFPYKKTQIDGVTAYVAEDKKNKVRVTIKEVAPKKLQLEVTDFDGNPLSSMVESGRNFRAMDLSGVMSNIEENRNYLRRRGQYILKRPYIEAEHEKAKKRKRKTTGVGDTWAGTYGVDWSYDGEQLIDDPEDVDQRIVLAKITAENLGIKYVHREGTTDEIHFETIETINTLVQSIEEIVPGAATYTPTFGMDNTMYNYRTKQSDALAYNVLVPRFYGSYSTSSWNAGTSSFYQGDGYEYDHSAIGLSVEMFGDDWDADRTYKIHYSAAGTKWWSIDPPDLEEPNGWEPWQALIISTLVHEIGHTFGYVGLGYLGTVRDRQRRQAISDKFRSDLSEIFADFGLLERGEYLQNLDIDRNYASNRNQQKNTMGYVDIDRGALRELLSEYGSVNLNELMAESFTEYMLAERPRPFAQAVGELLESTMKEFIDYEYGEID